MKKIILIITMTFLMGSLAGCMAGIETKSGWHMISLPPSSAKQLAQRCGRGSSFKMPFRKREVFK